MSVIFFDSPKSIDLPENADMFRTVSDDNDSIWNATNSPAVIDSDVIRNVTEGYHYSDLFGTEIAIPEWEAVLTILSLR